MPSGLARPRGLLIPGLSVVVLAAGFACSGVQHDESAEHVPSPQPGEKQPKLVASEDAFDFGEVPLGVRVEHSFVLRNEGDAPLEIGANPEVKLLEGCWPPSLVVGPTTLEPGESMNLVFPFKMGAGMGGPHRFQIHLKTNDPAAPTKILEVTALAQ